MSFTRLAPLAALLLTAGCAYDYAGGYAPSYPEGYDSGMGSGRFDQPGDQFGGQDVASVDVFLAPLSAQGRWVDSRYGRAFLPNAPQGWRPYVNGRWGENRLWISDDPWGWATDHYGRWGHDDRIGWVWVPGTAWAPSWVAWREDEAQDVAGWAPIPPGIAYSLGVGFGSGWGYDNWNSWYGPSWIWVPRQSLYRPGFGGILPWQYGQTHWRGSQWNHHNGWNNGWNNGGNNGWNNGGNNNPRPGGWSNNNPRPGYGRPRDGEWNGRPPRVGEVIGGSIAGTAPRERPNNWQGRPNGNQWQGNGQGNNSANTPRGEAVASTMPPVARPDRGERPAMAYQAPPQPPAAAPPPRAERPEPTQRQAAANNERNAERPQ